jgi:pimeloyl-ACP methyl ester carboxylesterase
MPYVDAYGAKLYFEESGHGYPIIFIHEFASDLRGWEAQVRYLSRSYRCITYNARGYPPSDVPEDASLYRWQFAVDDIAAVMRDLKIERAHLVGLSMGGYAALHFGLRYPDKASAIVAAGVDLVRISPIATPGCGKRRFLRGSFSSTEWSRWPI